MTTKVEFIQGSISPNGEDIVTTLICEYPRAIHAQLLTHGVFSKNSSSTRAVPLKSAIKNIKDNPAKYLWTRNQGGMQGPVITDEADLEKINELYFQAMDSAIAFAKALGDPKEEGGLEVHKQNAGRLLEPYQNIRICLTATQWKNWEWLRIDDDAQGEIADLARAMRKAREDNADKYMQLNPDEWHIPFTTRIRNEKGELEYFHPETGVKLELQDALNLSLSIAAQTSYRKEDMSEEKTKTVINRLFSGNKVHASPSEHQAKAFLMEPFTIPTFWPTGVTHMDRQGKFWSGNFKGWIQHRQLIPNHDHEKKF